MPPFLSDAAALVTTRAATRAGFVEVVIEKNRRATPHLDDARFALAGFGKVRIAT